MKVRFYHYIFIGFVFNAYPLQTQATAIVVCKVGNTVFIGADSQMSSEANVSINVSVCKIFQISDIYFAYSGVVYWSRPNFNAFKIARDCFSINTPFENRVSIFKDIFCNKFEIFVNSLDSSVSMNTRNELCDNRFPQTSIVIKPNIPTPILILNHFNVSNNINGHCAITSDSIGIFPDPFIFAFGDNRVIYRKLRSRPEQDWCIDPIKTIKYLITTEADSSTVVGGPIDILKIVGDKAEWIQRKKDCYNDWP